MVISVAGYAAHRQQARLTKHQLSQTMEGFESTSSTTNVNNSVLLAVSGVREGTVSLHCSTDTVLGTGVSFRKRN